MIFVIDISKSLDDESNFDTPINYQTRADEINNYMKKTKNHLLQTEQPEVFDICKLRIAESLLEIKNDTHSKFSIWTLGNEAELFFPDDDNSKAEIEVSSSTIQEAIGNINGLQNNHNNTNFTRLFGKILAQDDNITNGCNHILRPSVILVIISDMIHSIIPKNTGDPEGQQTIASKDRASLKSKIRRLSKANILANVIVLSSVFRETEQFETNVWLCLDEYFTNSRLAKLTINDNFDDLFYAPIHGKNCLKFFYANPYNIINSSYIVNIKQAGSYRIGTSLKSKILPLKNTAFDYQIYNYNNKPVTYKPENSQILTNCNHTSQNLYNGKLYWNGSKIELPNLQEGYKIELKYRDTLPPFADLPFFVIQFPKEIERVSHLIPISFRKRLQWLTAGFMLFLQSVVIISIAILLTVALIKLVQLAIKLAKNEETQKRIIYPPNS